MAYLIGPIVAWQRSDTTPTSDQGGYAGGASTAAAVQGALDEAGMATATVTNLTATGTALPYGSTPTVTVTGTVPNKVINIGVPVGMSQDIAGALVADAEAAQAAAVQAAADAQTAMEAQFATQDEGVADLIGTTAGPLTQSAGDERWATHTDVYERPIQPINAGAYEGTNDAAIRQAFDDAMTLQRPIEIPGMTFNLTGDLVLQPSAQSDRISIIGTGDESQLTFSGGGLKITGTGMLAHRPTLRDINIRRTGSSGAALWLHGDGAVGTGVARWFAANVYAVSTQGTACLIEGSYIGDFVGCYFLSSVDGVKVVRESARGITGANAVNFIGGEVQGCQRGVTMTATYGVSFLGTSIEGNSEYGVNLGDECNGTTFSGVYCEGNGGWDIRVAASSTSRPMGGVSIHGGTFVDAGKGKASSIELIKGQGIDIRGNYFGNQSFAPIRVTEATAGDVVGGQSNNLRHYPMPGNPQPVVTYGSTGAPMFDKVGAGRTYALSSNINPIPAHSTKQVALTAPGVRVGDQCSVSTQSLLEDGLVPTATVTATDTIVLRVANVTASEVDPAGRTWDFRVSR